MIERGHHARNREELRFDPFHLGMSHCLRFRELRCPWVQPCIEQLRYLLGYIHFQNSEDVECSVPQQLHWKYRRGYRRGGKFQPGPWDFPRATENICDDDQPRDNEI